VDDRRDVRGKRLRRNTAGQAGATWSGRGLRPRWLVAELKKGKKLQDFAIAK
jgi:DNA-binding protein H-NS